MMIKYLNKKKIKFPLRLIPIIYNKLKDYSEKKDLSMNRIINEALEEYFKEDRMEACYFCHGTGEHKDFQSGWMETCPVCKGTGGTYTDKKSGYQEPIKDRRENV